MKLLHLSGYGVKIKVGSMRPKSELIITNGREDFKEGETYSFRPRRIPYDSIFIDGHSGYISLQAFHWLSRNKVPIFILNYDGSLISSVLPPMPIKADIRAAQIKAYEDKAKKYRIAYELVKAKIQRTKEVLNWISKKHDIKEHIGKVEKNSFSIERVNSLDELRSIEGKVAL